MHVIPLKPRGYCHGVVSAIKEMKRVAEDETLPRPIQVLGMVVHNQKIVDDLAELGVRTLENKGRTRLELLDDIEEGTVVFTAHGVSDAVYEKAARKHLTIVDTTCRDVAASQNTVKEYLAEGYAVIFIGKKAHPETETVLSYSDHVHLVEDESDVEGLDIKKEHVALTNQTTMSLYDIYKVSEAVKRRFPDVELIEEICDATKTRQQAVINQPDVDHCFIVGDPRSNNTAKLHALATNRGVPASRIESTEDLDIEHLKFLERVSVTAGASTPTQITKEVIRFLEQFDPFDASTHDTKSRVKETNIFR